MPDTIDIKWEIPYALLIETNGVGTCLEIVPGTAHYLTHDKHYGKEAEKWENLRK